MLSAAKNLSPGTRRFFAVLSMTGETAAFLKNLLVKGAYRTLSCEQAHLKKMVKQGRVQ